MYIYVHIYIHKYYILIHLYMYIRGVGGRGRVVAPAPTSQRGSGGPPAQTRAQPAPLAASFRRSRAVPGLGFTHQIGESRDLGAAKRPGSHTRVARAETDCHQQPEVNYSPCFEKDDSPCRLHEKHVVCRVNHHSRNGLNSSLQVVGGGPEPETLL